MQKFIGVTIYILLTILFFPITLLGYLIWVIGLLRARRSGISSTAQGPLSARWLQHKLGGGRDEVASQLLLALPGVSPLAVWMVFAPTLLAHRLTGFIPATFRYPFRSEMTLQNQASARQSLYDAVVDQYINDMDQFVILGAGFDTRANRLAKRDGLRCFEVDTPKTLGIKQSPISQTKD